jgi:hypothetical protein
MPTLIPGLSTNPGGQPPVCPSLWLDETRVRQYIRDQEELEDRQGELDLE